MNKQIQKNVFGEPLEPCSNDPITGWFRDGLITPHPEFGFPGLKDGDSWCICATWYAKAIEEDAACSIFLKKTNVKTLDLIPIEKLKKFAVDLS